MSICRDLSLPAVQIHQLLARTAYIRQVTRQIYGLKSCLSSVWPHLQGARGIAARFLK